MSPDSPLITGTVYTAKMATTAKAWSGLGLAAAATWSFTTVPGPPPTVTDQNPDAGATNISIGTNVTATFDRALNPATVTTANVTLTPSGGSAIAATVSYNASIADDHAHPERAADPEQAVHGAHRPRA